jgi:uncharacterized protein
MRVGITGASGLIGTALTRHLEAGGHEVRPFVRRPAGATEISWDPERGTLDPGDLDGLDAVVHLAGAGIGDHRWTDEYKALVLDSRVLGTTLLAKAIVDSGAPRVLLSASAIGIYGSSDELVDERSPLGGDFPARVGIAWEASTAAAEDAGVRVAHLRTGIVLSGQGGALKKMLPLFKFGLGGRFGDGRQWMSWISIDDEVRAIEHLLDSDVAGPVNLTAPNACRNADFAKTLGGVLGRPVWLPVPEFGPKLLLGSELADSLVFGSQHVAPTVLLADGFQFEHPQLEHALRAVLGR